MFSSSKEFITALDDVSFDINKGDSVGLIGRNGSGKSTLLKILSGVYPQTSGKFYIKGKPVPILESGLGFHKDLNGYENIIFLGRLLGLPLKEIKSKIDEIAEFAEISDFIYTPIKHYSNGMISRLSFSVLPFLKGDIILMDEVLAFGDLSFQQKALKFLKNLHSQGKTIVVVSHHLNSLITLCNRFIVLQNGKYVNDGPPLKILPEYYEELLLHKAENRNTFIQTNLLKQSQFEFDIPFEMDGLKFFSAKILPSRSENNEFEQSEEICIEFNFQSENDQTVDFGIVVRDIMQNLIFSASAGQQQIYFHKNGVNNIKTIQLVIPTTMLNSGIFFIYPFLLHLKTKEYRLSEKSLAFRILSNEDYSINETVRLISLLGSVKLPISWKLK
ncbi:MAG: ABC transporter ATP-binding protein [Bacteroidales bacterium]